MVQRQLFTDYVLGMTRHADVFDVLMFFLNLVIVCNAKDFPLASADSSLEDSRNPCMEKKPSLVLLRANHKLKSLKNNNCLMMC